MFEKTRYLEYARDYKNRQRRNYRQLIGAIILGVGIIASSYGVRSCNEDIKKNKLEKQTEDVRIK